MKTRQTLQGKAHEKNCAGNAFQFGSCQTAIGNKPWKHRSFAPNDWLGVYFLLLAVFLFSISGSLQAQSSNCNCSGTLLNNGTFEGSNLSGWSASSSANVNFETGYDDCGETSLRLSRSSGSGMLDPAIWQQENNISAGKIYTLSFDAGTQDPSGIHRIFIRFYNVSGTLLSEDYLEVNHDIASDDQLKSYTFSMVAPSNASYLRIEAALDQDRLFLDNVCLVLASCTSPTFNFQSPTLISGSDSEVGAVYEFLNVVSGTNALMTIVSKTHSDVIVQSVDEPAITNGGYDWAFQPIIDYNYYNGGGANDPAGDKSVTFRFDFVDAATGELIYIPQINVTGVDIDGNGGTIREFIEASNFNYYEIQSPTELTLSGSLRALGNIPAWPGVTETALTTMISYVYNGTSSVEVTYGSTYNGGAHSSDASEDRMNCLYFKCYDFNTTVACPTIAVSGGNAVCSGSSLTLQASNTGGNGSCNIQWQYSINGINWTNLSGATGATYTTPALTNTTFYRATYDCSSGLSCGTVFSNVTTATVLPTCAEICNNNIDDDGDGFIDENDSDCANYAYCEADPGENIITGTVFNDANGNLNFDNGEYTPAGISIDIYEDLDGNGSQDGSDLLVGTVTTNQNGNYSMQVSPVFDYTTEVAISDPCNDAREGNDGENKIELGKDKDIGLRFTGVNIPSGSTINSAFLYFVSKNNRDKSGAVTIYGEDKKFPQNYCTNDDVNGRVRTAASVNWTVGNWVSGETYQSKDVKSIVQELVNSYGTYNNDELAFILISNGDDRVEAKTWETNGDGTEVPRLIINYTPNASVSYLAQIDLSTMPPGTTLNSAGLASVTFTTTGEADCNNNFSFTGSFEICDNGIDDDLDGFIDENDADCFATPDCTDTPGQNDIVGTVYRDANRNQVIDNGDNVHAGVTLNLYEDLNANGQVDGGEPQLQTDVSDVNGHYSFTVSPVFSDSENASINNACNDARDGNDGENRIQFGKDKDIGLRFTGITIPAGSTINSAYLYFTSKSNQAQYGLVDMYAEDVSNPADFCSNNDVVNRSRTSASVSWTMGNWFQDNEYQSADIKNLVQELVDSYTYNNGTMSFILISTGNDNVEAKTWETNGDGTEVPRLVINYGATTPYHYVVSMDVGTLPANTEATTPTVASAVFTASGTVDCNNDFGFASTVEICDNGIDDDGDGLTDCEDPDCNNGLAANASVSGGPVCPGGSLTLTATGSGGLAPYTFTWDSGLGAGASQTVNPLTNSTYIVTVTDANGCSTTGLAIAEVQACPEDCSNGIDDDLDNLTDCEDPDCNNGLSVSIGGATDVCYGATTTLTASASGGDATYSFIWSDGLGAGATKSVSPTSNKTYSVTVADGNGCTKAGSVNVVVHSLPTVIASGDLAICSGSSISLNASGVDGDLPYTFTWDQGLGAGADKTVAPSTTTTYTVTLATAYGCTDTEPVTVTVNQTPSLDAGPDETICNGFSTTLNATVSGGTSPYNFNWSNGLGGGDTHVISPTANTNYSVTVTSANGCVATDQVSISVQNCIEDCSNGTDDDGDGLTDCDDPDCGPTVNMGSDLNSCAGQSLTLTASASGGNGTLTFTWSNGLGDGQAKTVTPLVTTTYYVTVTASGTGCTSVGQVTVTIIPCGEDCTNGIDDDGDGLIDCDDPDCELSSAPQLADDNYSTCPGLPYVERVTYNDGNLQSPIFSIISQPTHGMVTIDATGKFTYTPLSTECVVDVFVYQVCNAVTGCCSTANVTISIGDDMPPTLTNVPADLTLGCDDAIPDPPLITAFDECPGIYVDYDETQAPLYAGACESSIITRTWTATDLCGNSATGTQNIYVLDQTKPEIFQVYTLENGKRIIAGVAEKVTHDWKYVPFPITFDGTPMIFTTVVSDNDLSAVTTRQRNAFSQGFELRLFEEENADGKHAAESVAWIAIEPGMNNGDLHLEAGRWDNVDENLAALNFSPLFGSTPGLLLNSQSTNDSEPVNVRLNSISSTGAEIFLQEEASADGEVDHGLEHIGYLAFSTNRDLTDAVGESFGETGRTNLTNAWTTISLNRTYTKPVVMVSGVSNSYADPVNVRVRNVTGNSFEVHLQEWDYLDGGHGLESISWVVMEGAIPGNQGYYCSGSATELIIGENVFAFDNCDDQLAFGYTETPSIQANGMLTTRTWMAIDDCGNTNLITRYDTCSTAALYTKVALFGAVVNNGGGPTMRDDLRVDELIPVREPYSKLPAFGHVKDHSSPDNGGNGGNNGGGADLVTICHMHGTSEERNMTIPSTALDTHLAHGDVLGGACSDMPPSQVAATYHTVADGDWNNSSTWEGGSIPPTGNVNNKTISIEHHVTLESGNLTLKNGAKLWIFQGGLTMNGGSISVQNGTLDVKDSDLNISGGISQSNGNCEVIIVNSSVNVGQNFVSNGGLRWLENAGVTVGNEYLNYGTDTLLNSFLDVSSNIKSLGGNLYAKNVKLKSAAGNIENGWGITFSGEGVKLWAEIGDIISNGTWEAAIDQYCVGGSATGLGGFLPISEDCAGMGDFFLPGSQSVGVTALPDNQDEDENLTAAEIAGPGTLDPVLLNTLGEDAVVDWLLIELRDAYDPAEIVDYATVILQRDGEVVSEDGDPLIVFPNTLEGQYHVAIRHRNHLATMTEYPIFLSVENAPLVDFTDTGLPVRGGVTAGRIWDGRRTLWPGDFNEDGKIIYQGPYNDVFNLFSRVLSETENTDYLANFIVNDYDENDLNLDGKVIYQGPNNDRAYLLYHSVLAHPQNIAFLANFIVADALP